MYGKIFESLYKGSMIGKGSAMFAVWGYVIANMRADATVGAQVDINPELLTFILGESPGVVEGVIDDLCGPDQKSTSKLEDGKRLVRIGEFSYRVVNGAAYMAIRNEQDRREYFRLKKQEQRAREKQIKDKARSTEYAKRKKEVRLSGKQAGAQAAIKEGLDSYEGNNADLRAS